MSNFKHSVLITGGTTGVGYHAARAIARQCPDHYIVIASRKDTQQAAQKINQTLKQSNVHFLALDLGDLKNVRAFAQSWAEKNLPPISVLLLNAGLQFPSGVNYTTDGFEATFGINHLGHALLFHLLQPHLATEARIVLTASGTHDPAQGTNIPPPNYTTAEEVAHPTGKGLTVDGRQRYSTSKLCNILWTYAVARRIEHLPQSQKKWTVVAFDPGLMPGTGLAREYGSVARFVWKHVLPALIPLLRLLLTPNVHRPEESGESLAWVALDDGEKSTTAVYYEGKKQIKSSIDSYDEKKQEDLWGWTVKTLAADEGERKQFEMI